METFKQINWLVSLVVGIALSILANLLTPYVQNWLATHSTGRALKRIGELEEELKEVSIYAESPAELSAYLLLSIVRLLVYFCMASAFATLGSLPLTMMPGFYEITGLIYALIGLMSSLLYLLGVIRGQRTLRIVQRVRRFPEYKKEIEDTISSLKLSSERRAVSSADGNLPPA
jgi:hypothetical protein